MTEVASPRPTPNQATTPEPPADADLIALVRAGDTAAYEELFLRHRDVALRYARRIADSGRAEDLCAEAFTKIFDLLQRGKGPDVAFRAYLLTTVRTSHLNSLRNLNREELVPDHEPISRMMPVIEDSDVRFDQHAILRAFSQLPERWQAALWLTSVEGMGHDEVSERLGIKANAVASLAFRARAGLRQAFLAEHLLETEDPDCRHVVEQLPGYYRDRLSVRRRQKIDDHLDSCRPCTRAALELSDVDRRLGALLAPLALTGFAVSGATATKTGLLALLVTGARSVTTKFSHLAGPQVVAVGVAAATTMAVGAGAVVLRGQQADPRPASSAEITRTAPSVEPRHQALPRHIARPAPRPTATTSVSATQAPTTPAPAPKPHRPTRPTSAAPTTIPKPADTSPVTPPVTPPVVPDPTSGPLGLGTPALDRGIDGTTVDLPVHGQVAGTTLTLVGFRTRLTDGPKAATGWHCGDPGAGPDDGLGGGAFSGTITCTYDGTGTGSAPRFQFWAAPGGALSAQVAGPSGYVDTTQGDDSVQVDLSS